MSRESTIERSEAFRAGSVALVKAITAESAATGAESRSNEREASCLTVEDLRETTPHYGKDDQTESSSTSAEETKGLQRKNATFRQLTAGSGWSLLRDVISGHVVTHILDAASVGTGMGWGSEIGRRKTTDAGCLEVKCEVLGIMIRITSRGWLKGNKSQWMYNQVEMMRNDGMNS